MGFTVIPNTSNLNDFLISNGFPKINKVFEEWNYFGIEGQYNRFIMKINFSYSFNSNSQTTNTNDFKTNMTINGIRGTFGYEILSKQTCSIFPLVGFEVSGISLGLTKSISDSATLQDLIAIPNFLKINQNNFLLMGEIGFRRMPNRNSSYGIYLGYKHDFTYENWHYQNIEFDNMPKFKLSGFYLNFSLQFNFFWSI